MFRFCSTLIQSRWRGLVSDPVSRALNRVYNGTRMRAGHCPESRFVSPVSRELSRVFFYDCVDCELFTAVSIFIVRKKRKKKRCDLNLWRRSMISLGGKCGVENFQNDFLYFLFPIETRVRSRKFYCIREARFDKSTRREREINFSIKTTTRLNLIFLYPNSIVIRTTDVLFSNKYIRD